MKLQLALDDITLAAALALGGDVRTYVDIIQDGTPFLKAGDTATDEQVWSLPQLLEGMEGQSSAQ